jgi:signal transduction histidine kinase/ActR/RegA family two-component response regulator
MNHFILDEKEQQAAFVKAAQYIMRLTVQQDEYEHLAGAVINFFKADWTAFAHATPSGELVIHHCSPPEPILEAHLLTAGSRMIASVLESGFLSMETLALPTPAMTVCLPLRSAAHAAEAMLIGYSAGEALPNDLLNLFLAMSGLAETAIGRLASERELRQHRDRLEELVQARTAELEVQNARLADEIVERKHAQGSLQALNDTLEARVAARTAELTEANAALRRASRMKDEFLATMSHELRTPLTAVLGLSEAMQMGIYGPMTEKQLKVLDTVRESGQHLLDLITDILDVSKLEAGKLELNPEPTAVQEICEASLRFVRQLAQKKDLHVSTAYDPQVRVMRVDARRLKQMLVNLLTNAVKFTPAGGEIGLAVEGDAARQEVRFVVWDTGIGIASENLPRLFQPFTQLDSRLAREYEGTGLGLALVKRLAQLHDGQVTVESEGAVGKGSRFTLSLPWLEKEDGGEPLTHQQGRPTTVPLLLQREPLAKDHALSVPAVLLIVDDNEATLMALSGYLQAQGYVIHTAQSGTEALAQTQRLKPDIILLDIQMPGLDGLAVIRHLRTNPVLTAIPVIALTALAMPGDRERCLEAGATAYMPKPVQLDRLRQLVQTLLQRPLGE